MQKKDIITLVFLLFLVSITSFISLNLSGLKIVSVFILILSGIKFLAISFQFMELKKANSFWRILISACLTFFITTIYFLL